MLLANIGLSISDFSEHIIRSLKNYKHRRKIDIYSILSLGLYLFKIIEDNYYFHDPKLPSK